MPCSCDPIPTSNDVSPTDSLTGYHEGRKSTIAIDIKSESQDLTPVTLSNVCVCYTTGTGAQFPWVAKAVTKDAAVAGKVRHLTIDVIASNSPPSKFGWLRWFRKRKKHGTGVLSGTLNQGGTSAYRFKLPNVEVT